MKKGILILSLILSAIAVSAHPWKPRHYVIVDTDGGLDDQKAICMLLASPDVRVLAITVSKGFHEETIAYEKVRSMVNGLWHEGLPVASGDQSLTLIGKTLSGENTPVTFIAMGSLQTAAKAMESIPSFGEKVKQIIWSNDGLPGREGFNYITAPEAAEKVLASSMPVLVTGPGGSSFYDTELITDLENTHTPYSSQVVSILKTNASHNFVFTAYDEMVPLLLHYPMLFKDSGIEQKNKFYTPDDVNALRKATVRILKGETVVRMQVVKVIPADTSFYMTDIQPFVMEIRNKYGEDEWASGVIANELHRHLGVFAIIGVKMGIRAREYFCTGVDEMTVSSHAGSMPPLSCMNDGIQVSTGATPGHGLLTVSTDAPFFPAADFTHKGTTLRITLKKELADRLSSELKEINFVYGLDSDIYWELVRKNTIKYWLQLDRHEIFDIEVLNSN
ncbi:MAG TPA: FmdE family protein [Bacteroidales bacterium]|nr:FmdE family protein [Bacteroidales bacterium]